MKEGTSKKEMFYYYIEFVADRSQNDPDELRHLLQIATNLEGHFYKYFSCVRRHLNE